MKTKLSSYIVTFHIISLRTGNSIWKKIFMVEDLYHMVEICIIMQLVQREDFFKISSDFEAFGLWFRFTGIY